jgi:hypothetical protein
VLQLTLHAAQQIYTVGDTPTIAVRVRNVSTSPLLFVGVLDGSEFGLRYPHYIPEVSGPSDVRSQVEAPDFTAPLRRTDVRTLQPGEEFDPTDRSGGAAYVQIATFLYLASAPGRYTVSLTVSTECDTIEPWLGTLPAPRDPVVPDLIARIPRLTVRSPLLTIDVRDR